MRDATVALIDIKVRFADGSGVRLTNNEGIAMTEDDALDLLAVVNDHINRATTEDQTGGESDG